MEKVSRYLLMVINMMVNIKMVNLVEKEDMNGNKDNIIKDNFMKVYVKEMGN